MLKKLAEMMQPVLGFSFIRQTRRNHGLEHATVHVLSENLKQLRIAGRSTNNGFILIGNVPTKEIENAANEALKRMKRGEHHLATHPNCGTNLATTGALTALVGLISFNWNRRQSQWDRFSWMMAFMTLATVVAQPLGMDVQKHITTEGDPGDMEVVGVTRHVVRWPFRKNPITIHQVTTRKG
jgi:hypothetical protein